MFNNEIDLAENKLLLLYTLRELKIPVSKKILTEIILQSSYLNYFILQQYISELEASGFVNITKEDNQAKLNINKSGSKVLSYFENRISPETKKHIDDFIQKNMDKIKEEISVTADYTIENSSNYIVSLKATENKLILIDIKISVATQKQAKDLCNNWKNNSSQLYNSIINTLTKDH